MNDESKWNDVECNRFINIPYAYTYRIKLIYLYTNTTVCNGPHNDITGKIPVYSAIDSAVYSAL